MALATVLTGFAVSAAAAFNESWPRRVHTCCYRVSVTSYNRPDVRAEDHEGQLAPAQVLLIHDVLV